MEYKEVVIFVAALALVSFIYFLIKHFELAAAFSSMIELVQ